MGDEEDYTIVVLDCGSGMFKGGIAGEDSPMAVFPCVVSNTDEVGDDALAKKGATLCYPVLGGLVNDWDALEKVWRHAFATDMKLDPYQCPVLLTEPPLNPKAQREKAAEALLSSVGCPSMFLAIQAVAAAYSTGRSTGIVFDSGDGSSHAVPVYEGYALTHAIRECPVAGRHITDAIAAALPAVQAELVKTLKEKHAYVAADVTSEDTSEKTCKVNDSEISFGAERFKLPEAMFDPSILGLKGLSAPAAILAAIEACERDVQPLMIKNVLLAGGNTVMKGFSDRMTAVLTEVHEEVKLVAPPERKYSTWIGGANLSAITTFRRTWVSQDDFSKHGAKIVHTKCFF